jgi:hypothetical protein
MSALLTLLVAAIRDIVIAILPMAILLVSFQLFVLKRPIPNLRSVLAGFGLLIAGMALFLAGLEEALFPLGRVMADQLTSPEIVGDHSASVSAHWGDYWLVYVFGAAIGFATTIAEPALIAVAMKARSVSGDTLSSRGLRVAVASGVAIGIGLGCFRIVTGSPLPYFIIVGYVLVVLQALQAPRSIIALAFDSGGVTTSTVTVPIIAALGLGLASEVPGRSPLVDGFGLIAFASLFPMMTVMGYAQIGHWRTRRQTTKQAQEE